MLHDFWRPWPFWRPAVLYWPDPPSRKHTDEKGHSTPAKSKVAKGMRNKVHKVMHEFKHGELHSGSKKGPKVKSRKQAIAIALSEARGAK